MGRPLIIPQSATPDLHPGWTAPGPLDRPAGRGGLVLGLIAVLLIALVGGGGFAAAKAEYSAASSRVEALGAWRQLATLRRPVGQVDRPHPPAGWQHLRRRPPHWSQRRRSRPQPPPRQRQPGQPPQSHQSFPPQSLASPRRATTPMCSLQAAHHPPTFQFNLQPAPLLAEAQAR
jgi:hypothetical protein